MVKFTGKRFVTKSTWYGVVNEYWSERKKDWVKEWNHIWGVWDKELSGFVCNKDGIIIEEHDRGQMLGMAKELNEDGYSRYYSDCVVEN